MAKILIIEDEPLIAEDLQITLEQANFEIIGPYHSGPDDLREIIDLKPDLALLDINLNTAVDGVDIAKHLSPHFPIIFVTSYYDEQTLNRVLKVKPHGYIVKPYREEEILMNVRLALAKKTWERNQDPKISIKTGNKSTFIEKSEIAYLKAESNYTRIIMKNNKEYVVSQTLKIIQAKLCKLNFVRIHKSYVINSTIVQGISGGKILLVGTSIPIGRTYKDALKKHLGI